MSDDRGEHHGDVEPWQDTSSGKTKLGRMLQQQKAISMTQTAVTIQAISGAAFFLACRYATAWASPARASSAAR